VKLEVCEARTPVLQLRWYSMIPCDTCTILKNTSSEVLSALKNTVPRTTKVNSEVEFVANRPRYACYSQVRIAIQLDRYQKDLEGFGGCLTG
jgi:hypothetical protein